MRVAVVLTALTGVVVARILVVERARFDDDVVFVKESIEKAEWRLETVLDHGRPYLYRLVA